LLLCGAIGPLLFIVVFLIEGATRPGYSVSRNFVSDLALSDQGWEQIANFIFCGVMLIAFAVGLRQIWGTGRASFWGPLLIGLMGLELIIAGLFVIDPGRGYPPGAPLTGEPSTIQGWIHGLNGLVLFNLVLPAACFVLAWRFAADPQNRIWATYSRITAAVLILASVVTTVASPFAEKGGVPFPIGIIQRFLIIVGWVWLALTALRLLRQERRVPAITVPFKESSEPA
jgi:hypothetical protein